MPAVPDHEEHILDALLTMVVADGFVDPDELVVASRVYGELTGHALEPQTLEARALDRLDGDTPRPLPPALGDGLDDETKRRVLGAALAIAEADGFVLEEEDAVLAGLEKALGLPVGASRETAAHASSPGLR